MFSIAGYRFISSSTGMEKNVTENAQRTEPIIYLHQKVCTLRDTLHKLNKFVDQTRENENLKY